MQEIKISDFILQSNPKARQLYQLLATNSFKGVVTCTSGLMGNAIVTLKVGYFRFYLTRDKSGNIPIKINGELWWAKPIYIDVLHRNYNGKANEITGIGF